MRTSFLLAMTAGMAMSGVANAQWVTFADQTAERLSLSTVGMNDTEEKDVVAADLDNDGWTDVVVVRKLPFSNPGKRQDVLLMNEGGVLVDRTAELAHGFIDNLTDARDVAVGDIDGDGWLDLAIGTTFDDQPRLYRNLGEDGDGVWLGLADESFRLEDIGQAAFPFKMCSISVADVNMDGSVDIYMTNYEGGDDLLMINDGTGIFHDETATRLGALANVAFGTKNQIRDMDNDGDNDLIKVSTLFGAPPFNSTGVYILWNKGDGMFESPNGFKQVPGVSSPYMLEITDLDNDGDNDIYVVQDPQDSYHHITINGPENLSFQSFSPNPSPRTTGFGGNADSVDIDNDGDRDIMVTPVDVDIANCGSGRYALLQNDGTGKLGDPWGSDQPWHTFAHDAVQFDIDNDGCDDIFQGLCTGWRVFIQTDGNCEPDCYADFNGDGSLNILDFVAFQDAFTAGDDAADCNGDGSLNILDFVCFQNTFAAGC